MAAVEALLVEGLEDFGGLGLCDAFEQRGGDDRGEDLIGVPVGSRLVLRLVQMRFGRFHHRNYLLLVD